MATKTRNHKEIVKEDKLIPIPYLANTIELCKQNGIKYFKSPELELHFNDKTEPLANPVSVEKADKEERKEQLLGDLLLENPLAYEEALNRE